MESEKKSNIGGLWLKTSKAGNKFMSGSIEINGISHSVVIFKNRYKTKETHPDYVIMPPAQASSTLPPLPPKLQELVEEIPF